MKTTMLHRVLFLHVSLLLFFAVNAQSEYLPLVLEGAHWKVCRNSSTDLWDCGRIFEYHISGDTLVEGLAYKNVYIRDFRQNGEPGGGWDSYDWPLEVTSQLLAGFIREDVSGRKVYWRDSENFSACESENEEVLLFDFTLEVGDAVPTCIPGSDPIIVQDIATEELYGEERTVYYLPDGYRQIEGIGFSTGLLAPPSLLLNSLPDEIIDYCVGNDMDCGVVHNGNMINPYREWHLINESYGFSTGYYSLVTAEYRLRDTVQYDGHIYYKLQVIQRENADEWADVQGGFGFRQDGSRIYRFPSGFWNPEEGEKLIYDFDLMVGDTFDLEGLSNYLQPMQLRDTDTVVIDNGEERRRFIFAPEEWQGGREWYWIEGIGANDHPFFPEESFIEDLDGGREQIQCFYRSTDLSNPIWRNPDHENNGCYVYIVDTDELSAPPPRRIYPNPTNARLYVEGVLFGEVLKVYSPTGQIMQAATGDQVGKLEVDITKLPSGLYFWTLFNTDGQPLQSGKVMKE
ncbi:MAG: T9SS type A sorting domain-containing protein [Bacteroidota bacterium]